MTTKDIPTTAADALKALSDRLGGEETARRIGVSQSTVSMARTSGRVRKTTELAARYELQRISGGPNTDCHREPTEERRTYTLLVPEQSVDATRHYADALGLKVQRFLLDFDGHDVKAELFIVRPPRDKEAALDAFIKALGIQCGDMVS